MSEGSNIKPEELLNISEKKKAPAREVEAIPTKRPAEPGYSMPTTIRVNRAEAANLQVGDDISVNLSGTIKSIRDASFNDEAKKEVEIELAGPTVSSVAMNAADYEMKRMVE